uniref:Uncharacterized protein n=1 Tax=Rangifer tarandus platyrhynchus TaxID=3082113 RepID=A0ACB0EP90_RANTA|nr:unnamed protein product [Rangifer tarandus platyrhynchus]
MYSLGEGTRLGVFHVHLLNKHLQNAKSQDASRPPQPRCPHSLHGAAGARLSRSQVPPADLKRQLDSTASPLTSHSSVWSWDLHSHDFRQPCVSRAACQRTQNTLNEQKRAARGHLCKVRSGPQAESTPHQVSRQLSLAETTPQSFGRTQVTKNAPREAQGPESTPHGTGTLLRSLIGQDDTCRGPRSGKITSASERLSPSTTTSECMRYSYRSPCALQPALRSRRSPRTPT